MAGRGEIPNHLRQSLYRWTRQVFLRPGDALAGIPWIADRDLLEELERVLPISPALNWTEPGHALEDLMERFETDDAFAMRLIERLLAMRPDEYRARELADILDSPGSRWEVSGLDGYNPSQEFHLVLRGAGPVPEVIAAVAAHSEPAHNHLVTAWTKLTQQEPEPGMAVDEAVRAVEAAAKQTVTPDDPKATLGKMADALAAKPEKWRVVLESEEVDDVQRRLEILRRFQEGRRHGSDQPLDPASVQQAEAAVALALELVSYFANGSIRRLGET